MLALIAGTGDLPPALVARLPERPLVCALHGFVPVLEVDVTFRLEQLGSFLADLKARGVTRICMAGAVRRPQIDPALIDAATMPLIPKVQAAMAKGDDGALRVIITLFEEAGFAVVAAHEIAPDLLPPSGVLTKAQPADPDGAAVADECLAAMGAADQGQACIVTAGRIVMTEEQGGTDAMIAKAGRVPDGFLFKAPKPDQDRRADLPLIGPATAKAAAQAGMAGIVIEAGGVMVLELPEVLQVLDTYQMFLWVRPRPVA
jgi:DUF1009 family protein